MTTKINSYLKNIMFQIVIYNLIHIHSRNLVEINGCKLFLLKLIKRNKKLISCYSYQIITF